MNLTAYVWLALMVFFLLIEVSTVALVSVWFAVGALAALVVSLLGGSTLLQVVSFLAVSAVLLGLLRPFSRRYIAPKIVPTNVDSLIGTMGILTADVDNLASTGQVKLGAMTWTARSASGKPIPAGTKVRVDRIEGVKAIVIPAEETLV